MKLFQAIRAKYRLKSASNAAGASASNGATMQLKPQYGRRKNMRDYRDF
jgi:hypothetical protein